MRTAADYWRANSPSHLGLKHQVYIHQMHSKNCSRGVCTLTKDIGNDLLILLLVPPTHSVGASIVLLVGVCRRL